VIFPQDEVEKIFLLARDRAISSYLDGARLWNVSVASGRPLQSLAAPFDLVSVALSKGLGAPGGSLLIGSREIIRRCVRYRRMLGGAMRQVGILAAAGLYAIEHNIDRLSEDHANARLIAERLDANGHFIVDMNTVQTNILIFSLAEGAPDAATVVTRAKERGVLVFAFGPRTIRAVTHLDVSREQCERAAEVFVEAAKR
jgi:threonine aldolase